ncbi:hypothetical protein QL285_070062 [Trifolium repens]|nr:hypothetical protein QL285_070062 [Trifolium repens]
MQICGGYGAAIYVDHSAADDGSECDSDDAEGVKFNDSEDERAMGLDDGFGVDTNDEPRNETNMRIVLSSIGVSESESKFEDDEYESEELGSSDPDASDEERGVRYEKFRKDQTGDADRQYSLLRRYADELRSKCKHNTVKIGVERPIPPDLHHRFGNFYFCFDGCKKGFINGCRPFIGVDGCHLKTKYGGQILIAVGRDPNDQYFPLAFGVVETETKESWRWFIQLLLEDVGQHNRFVFISDQQKGLVAVFEEMEERIEHSSCKSKVQDPNGLKRKRKPPKGKVPAEAKGKVPAEAKSGANHKSDANPSTEPVEANASQPQEAAPVEADQTQNSATVEVSQVDNPPQNSATVQADQGSATVATHGLFDEIPDEIMATIPDITMDAIPKQGQVKAEKGMASKKQVKLYHGKIRRESERIKVNQMKKPFKGVGSTATEPIVINEADEGVLTQEEQPKLGTCFRSMKSWKNLREN